MQNILEQRTGLYSWIPKRSGSEDLVWNIEGDLYRNKGRVLTSMLILYPRDWKQNKILLTQFGSALANGQVKEKQYYDFLLTHFKYPHPAWDENWKDWNDANVVLYPFIYILQSLTELYRRAPEQASLTVQEVADYLHPTPNHEKVIEYVGNILLAREDKSPATTPKSDEIHRKIGDVLGFLCLTSYCFFNGERVFLNLNDKHKIEKSNFWGNRNKQDKLSSINKLISVALEQ
jgi:hypothetical protein